MPQPQRRTHHSSPCLKGRGLLARGDERPLLRGRGMCVGKLVLSNYLCNGNGVIACPFLLVA